MVARSSHYVELRRNKSPTTFNFIVIPKKSKAGIGFSDTLTRGKRVINYACLFLQWSGERKPARFIVSATSLRLRRRITNLFFNSDPLFSSGGNREVSRIKEILIYVVIASVESPTIRLWECSRH